MDADTLKGLEGRMGPHSRGLKALAWMLAAVEEYAAAPVGGPVSQGTLDALEEMALVYDRRRQSIEG